MEVCLGVGAASLDQHAKIVQELPVQRQSVIMRKVGVWMRLGAGTDRWHGRHVQQLGQLLRSHFWSQSFDRFAPFMATAVKGCGPSLFFPSWFLWP